MAVMYHVSNVDFSIGQEISPGNWAKIKDEGGNLQRDLREYIFEKIRKEFYYSCVSRFFCFFAFKDIETARLFIMSIPGFSKNFIYEVEFDEKNIRTFEGDLAIITWINQFNINQIEATAHEYWSKKNKTHFKETLIEGPVKVIRKVE